MNEIQVNSTKRPNPFQEEKITKISYRNFKKNLF